MGKEDPSSGRFKFKLKLDGLNVEIDTRAVIVLVVSIPAVLRMIDMLV